MISKIKKKNLKLTFLNIIFFSTIFLISRLFLIVFFFEEGADWEKYLNVAKNILNGCGVSQSYLEFETCKLSFGPNNGPGYPFYLSFFLIFLKGSINNLVYINLLFSLLANLYLLSVIKKFYSLKLFNITLLLLSLSPLTIGWYRFLLPEVITFSFGLVLLAELIILLKTNKVHLFRLSIPIIIASFIRLDALSYIFLIFVIFYFLFKKDKFKVFIKNSILVSLIISIPWNLWFIRNYIVNADVVVPLKLEKLIKYEKNYKYPDGFHRWVSTWSYTEYSRSNALHNIQFSEKKDFKKYTYENIILPKNIYYSSTEKKKTEELFSELKLHSGKPFPESINEEFSKLAENRLDQKIFDQYFFINLKRILFLLFNPVSSNGLPIEINNENVYQKIISINNNKIKILLLEFKKEIPKYLLKSFTNIWKILLICIFLYLILFRKEIKNTSSSILLKACYSFYFIKILFLSIFFLLESRYLATAFQFIEISMLIYLYENKFTNFSKKN